MACKIVQNSGDRRKKKIESRKVFLYNVAVVISDEDDVARTFGPLLFFKKAVDPWSCSNSASVRMAQ